jgi:zinc transport system substrate-binding protein
MNAKTIAIAAVAVLLIAGIGAFLVLSHHDDDGRDTITVTMSWEKEIVEDIAGDRFKVVSMLGPNVSPHEAYSTPSNISDLYGSVMYFKIGSGVEWERAFLDSVQKDIPSKVRIVDIASSIEYVALPNTHHHHHDGEQDDDDDDEESAYDAHIWTSPDILRSIAKLVRDKLTEIDPENASEYSKNLSEYLAKADKVDEKMRAVADLVGSEHTHVMVWHPAWQYLIVQYSERFGADLHQESVEEDGEVSPAEAAAIVKGEGGKSIFVSTTDEGYEGRKALEEAGITVHIVNPTATDMLGAISEFLDYLESDLKV